MVSNTQQTQRIRARHQKRAGKRRKHEARRRGTPSFPIHLPDYDPNAPDAKRPASGSEQGRSA